jgi:hypothetical protein
VPLLPLLLCRFPAPPPAMPAGHLWQGRRPPRPSISPLLSPCRYLCSSSSSRPPLCTRSAPIYTLEHPIHHRCHLCISLPPEETPSVKCSLASIFYFSGVIISLTRRLLSRRIVTGSCSAWALVPTRRSTARAPADADHHRRCSFLTRGHFRSIYVW